LIYQKKEAALTIASEQRKILRNLFESQKLAVLATHSGGQPYANLMAFAASKNLKRIVIATTRSTRKFANLTADSRVAILFDNRSNTERDFHKAVTVTATGKANEVSTRDKKRLQKFYLDRHPHLEGFVTSPTCALMIITVEVYYIVTRFQNVMELHIKQ
jgi:nitroimidazol reductase NimA-like FMN-containing flavoprotein (pyridoxamine 5'-phosphate oxidase superfamily)